jgi:DNA-binding CsgD family transcriptional regulator
MKWSATSKHRARITNRCSNWRRRRQIAFWSGKLWASRDYTKTGHYIELVLALAQRDLDIVTAVRMAREMRWRAGDAFALSLYGIGLATTEMQLAQTATALRRTPNAHGGLTRHERDVVALLVEGKSNRTITEELILGERTVEGYVSSILNKLGFTSHVQIAAWAVANGLQENEREL